MQSDIHPKYKKLKIIIDTDIFETNSTYAGDEILMDIDYRKHPAWTKEGTKVVNQSNANISSFNKKFGSIFTTKK